jgi:hypothetical protein
MEQQVRRVRERSCVIANESIVLRQKMLAQWYLAALQRYERPLDSTRARWPIRVGSRSYYVTGEELHNALDTTYHELHSGFASHRTWGVDSIGNAFEVAVIGLAQRRLQARLVDQLRRGHRSPTVVDLNEHHIFERGVAELALPATIVEELKRESVGTQQTVLLAGAGYSAPEIASRLGVEPAAVRKRLSRFGRRVRLIQEAA